MKRKQVPGAISSDSMQIRPLRTILALVLLLTSSLQASPGPGDVFREYTWKPSGAYHVLTQKQAPLDFTHRFDLAHAVRAETVLEIGNAHLGFADFHIRVNGGEWHRIAFPELAPQQPSPSRWFCQWQPAVQLPLSELRSAAPNRFELRVAPKTYEGTIPHPAYTCVYSITFRIYYEPGQKPQVTGEIAAPSADSELGARVNLVAKGQGRVRQIDFVGRYENLNYEGDGFYDQWHCVFEGGRLVGHLGTTDAFGKTVTWDTSWVPNQKRPIQIAARLTDEQDLVMMTKAVGGLVLLRPGQSVELAKPYDVPMGFTSCQYGAYVTPGSKAEKFKVTGDVTKIVAARFAISCWNGPANHGFMVNGQPLEGVKLEGFAGNHHLFVVPLAPLSVLQTGENTFATIPGSGRSSDIHWPGVAVLIQYRE
jgi:hypothetical protein